MLEAAVVGAADEKQADQTQGVRRAQAGRAAGDELAESALKQHVKDHLAPFKYPRWIEFLAELPKTATGKIQRFKLRARG